MCLKNCMRKICYNIFHKYKSKHIKLSLGVRFLYYVRRSTNHYKSKKLIWNLVL